MISSLISFTISLVLSSIASLVTLSSSSASAFSSASSISFKSKACPSSFMIEISSPKAWNSFINTLNDSGLPASFISCPLTIDSNTLTRPTTSSDFTVIISCNV